MSVSPEEIKDFSTAYFGAKLAIGDLTKPMRELRIDSLDFVEFLMALEEKFAVQIDTDAIPEDMTLEQFCTFVAAGK